MENRPRGRQTHNVGGSGSVNKRGSGLGTGPVGTSRPTSSRPSSSYSSGNYGGPSPANGPVRRSGGGFKLAPVILILVIFFVAKSFFGGNGGSMIDTGSTLGGNGNSALNTMVTVMQLFGGLDYTTTTTEYSSPASSSGYNNFGFTTSSSKLDTSVAPGSRAKRTNIIGNGRDDVTIMVYMCGTDLESKNGMASSDIKEMCAASLSDNVNVIIYTGGTNQWKISGISNRTNQIYKVQNGNLICLEDNMGNKSMVDPSTLTEFIRYCTTNFPANRQELIMWDHGGGSISGYGYDEKVGSGSMTLAGIDKALRNSGATFDFIGFDACLMGTVENGLMLSKYADYMIASEETEPGVGWYYTNWLTALSKNTSMPTIEIGKNIIDDFVDVCNYKCNGQKTTLSIVDLAELEKTVPSELKEFAVSTNNLIKNDNYKVVSNARANSKEFAVSSKIDQIDLVDFAKRLGTAEGTDLANAILGAVKYNRSASCVSDANGLSIYFPYKKSGKVRQIVQTYDAIGMDSEYARCIQEFASLETCGQQATGGTTTSPLDTLFGTGSSSSSNMSGDLLGTLLSSFLRSNNLDGSTLTADRAAAYISNNHLNDSHLTWTTNSEGRKVLAFDENDWSMTETIDLNVYYDDGEGYIDLGMDNILNYDNAGNLYGEYDGTWLSINGQVVAYYHTDTVESGNDYVISGYIPAMLNGERVEIIVEFSNDNPYGVITGARYVYKGDVEVETVAKSMFGLQPGDKVDFICDYYTYDGRYSDSYYLGDTMTLGNTLELGNIAIDESKVSATYCVTDIYQQKYWTDVIE